LFLGFLQAWVSVVIVYPYGPALLQKRLCQVLNYGCGFVHVRCDEWWFDSVYFPG
jgi:hypothetical protein